MQKPMAVRSKSPLGKVLEPLLILIVLTGLALAAELGSSNPLRAYADETCSDTACQNIPSDKQAVAQELMQYIATGAITAPGDPNGVIDREIGAIAAGTCTTECNVDVRTLQTILIVVKHFGSAQINDLNRTCLILPPGWTTCLQSPSSKHCYDNTNLEPSAVDFGRVGGMGIDASSADTLFNFIAQFAPRQPGGTRTEALCGDGDHGPYMSKFAVNGVPCSHHHIDFANTSLPLNIPAGTSSEGTHSDGSFVRISDGAYAGAIFTAAGGYLFGVTAEYCQTHNCNPAIAITQEQIDAYGTVHSNVNSGAYVRAADGPLTGAIFRSAGGYLFGVTSDFCAQNGCSPAIDVPQTQLDIYMSEHRDVTNEAYVRAADGPLAGAIFRSAGGYLIGVTAEYCQNNNCNSAINVPSQALALYKSEHTKLKDGISVQVIDGELAGQVFVSTHGILIKSNATNRTFLITQAQLSEYQG